MNRVLIAALTSLVLLCPSITLAQSGQSKLSDISNVTNVTSALDGQTGMYEDIEIMRRLLNGKLPGFSAAATIRAQALVNGTCTKCHQPNLGIGAALIDVGKDGRPDLFVTNPHGSSQLYPNVGTSIGTGVAWADFDGDGHLDLFVTNPHGSGQLYRNLGNGKFEDVTKKAGDLANYHSYHRGHLVVGSASFDTEGTYLKGHGVVYSLTLPPPARDPRPQAPKSPPKPLSDWERIRRDVRQEKPAAAEAENQPKESTLGDIVLKTLADNGRNFSQLGKDESLTVAITFRAPIQVQNVGLNHPWAFDASSAIQEYDQWFQEAHPNTTLGRTIKPDPPPQPGGGATTATTSQDYALLGDLHMKQGRGEEAFRAYHKAFDLNKDASADHILYVQAMKAFNAIKNRSTELELAGQKVDELRNKRNEEQLKAAKEEKSQKPAEAKPTPLPGKLVITASKKLLDDVGSGKISFEDFKKAASVEYVTFAAERK